MGRQMTTQRDDQFPTLHREPGHIEHPADNNGGSVIRFRRFCAMPRSRQFFADGQPVVIGSRAFDLLVVLLEARGSLVTKTEIMDRVWPSTFVDDSNVRVQMGLVRRALGEDRDLIKNVPGRGYVLAVELDRDAGAPHSAPAPDRYGRAAVTRDSASTDPVHGRLREAQLQLARVARLATKVELTASAAHEVTERLTAIITNAQGCLLQLVGVRADQVGVTTAAAARPSAASKVTQLRRSPLGRSMARSAPAIT